MNRYMRYKLSILFLKYIPILMSLIFFIHVGLLLLGINTNIAEYIAGVSILPAIIIIVMSEILKFCTLHRLFTIYSLLVDFCINYNRNTGFYNLLHLFRLLVFCIGLVLFIYLLSHLKIYKKKSVILVKK